jgi:hypothetical protein
MIRFGGAKIDEWRKLVYVQEILDATRFVGVWRGQTYECRAAPNTSPLTVGDTVMCHVMPGNSELIAVRPVSGEVLFVSVGGPDEFTPAVFMFTSPTVAPTKIFQQVDTGVLRLVTAMAWCQATNSLIFVCSATDGGGDTHDIYEYHIGDASPTLRHSYEIDLAYGVWASCVDMAEYGGQLYFWHAGTDDESLCARCDPTNIAATFEVVFTAAGPFRFNPSEGGLAVIGTTIYALDGDRVYSSPSGDVGSWAQVHDLWTLNGESTASGLVSDPNNDCAYFCTWCFLEEYEDFFPVLYRCIRRINADGSLTLEHKERMHHTAVNAFVSISWPYPPSTDTQPAALQWYANHAGEPRERTHDVYRRQADGSWTFEDSGWQDPDYTEPCPDGIAGTCGNWFTILGCNQGSVYWQGHPYVIVEGDWVKADLTRMYRRLLLRQAAVGTWEEVYDFAGYSTDPAEANFHFAACMTVGRTTKRIQNL